MLIASLPFGPANSQKVGPAQPIEVSTVAMGLLAHVLPPSVDRVGSGPTLGVSGS